MTASQVLAFVLRFTLYPHCASLSTEMDKKPTNTQPDFSEFFKEDYGVFLLRGKNSFGNLIYSYVKVSFSNIDRVQHCLKNRLPFNPSDFGEVIAAGTGEPPPEVQAEIAALYPMIDQKPSDGSGATSSSAVGASAAPPIAKKAWDEY